MVDCLSDWDIGSFRGDMAFKVAEETAHNLLLWSILHHHIGYPWLNLLLTMSSYMLIIPFMRKFMPHVTAQKDVITINNLQITINN